MFHGVNMVAKRPPYDPVVLGFDEDDARFLAANGFRAVRLGVIWKGVEPLPGAYDEHYIAQIKHTVGILARVGIYSLLDFHEDNLNEYFGGEGFPDWAVLGTGVEHGIHSQLALRQALDAFWTDSPGPGGVGLQERYAAAVARVARQFTDDRAVIGYDLINEPFTGSRWPTCFTAGDCSGFDRELGAFQLRVMLAIRLVDHRHLVWYEPNVLFDWGLPTELPHFEGSYVGMSFHDYCAPSGSCDDVNQRILANAEHRAASTGDALLMTEFGSGLSSLRRVLPAADEHRLSWFVWAYCGCQDPSGTMPPDEQAVVFDPTRPPIGANIALAKLALLVRPYPEATAGTPLQFEFDTTTKTFTLTYSTRRADGHGRFGSSACTEVFVPQLQYPNGYQVAVTGGRAFSTKASETVVLRARDHARKVTVRITPASRSTHRLPRTTDCPRHDLSLVSPGHG